MSLDEILDENGLTRDQAWDWIVANLSQPQTIVNVCAVVGVNSQHLAELASDFLGSISASDVENYISSRGADITAISIVQDAQTVPDSGACYGEFDGVETCTPGMQALSEAAIKFNDESGVLSTANLREQVLQQVSEQQYWQFFEVDSEDEYFSETEPCSMLIDVEPTPVNIESLYYGMATNYFRNMDVSELAALEQYGAEVFAGITEENYAEVFESALEGMYFTLAEYLQTPAQSPEYSEAQAVQELVSNTVSMMTDYEVGDSLGIENGEMLFDSGWYDFI